MAVSHVFSNAIADWTGTVTVFDSAGATGTVAATALVRPSNWNSAHNQLFTITGNTTNSSTASGTNVVFSGAGGVTLGGSSDTIVFSGPLCSYWAYMPAAIDTRIRQANSSVSINPFFLECPLVFSNARFLGSLAVGSAANNSSAYFDMSVSMVIYTASGSTLSSVASLGKTLTASWSSNATLSHGGGVVFDATCAQTTLQAGLYFAALHISTTNSATGGANTTALGNSFSVYHDNVLPVSSWHSIGQGTNATYGIYPGRGLFSTNATRASLAFSDYTQGSTDTTVRAAPFLFELRNQTFQ